MNNFDALWFFMLICSFDLTSGESNSNSKNSQLFIGKYPIPPKTSSPLNIDSDKVKHETLPPLIFRPFVGSDSKVTNTGYSVEAVLDQDQKNPGALLTGGPLQNDTYNYLITRYFWTNNSNEQIGTLVDGADGGTIILVAFFYNLKYESFENSKNYRDGMVATAFPVVIRPLPSLTFIPFAEKLKQIREPGSHVISNSIETFIWANYLLTPLATYFAYPGSYLDDEDSKEYYCTTVIEFREKADFISQEQFEDSFLSLKNSNGEQLTDVIPANPQNDIPVIQAEGQVQMVIPLGENLLDVTAL